MSEWQAKVDAAVAAKLAECDAEAKEVLKKMANKIRP